MSDETQRRLEKQLLEAKRDRNKAISGAAVLGKRVKELEAGMTQLESELMVDRERIAELEELSRLTCTACKAGPSMIGPKHTCEQGLEGEEPYCSACAGTVTDGESAEHTCEQEPEPACPQCECEGKAPGEWCCSCEAYKQVPADDPATAEALKMLADGWVAEARKMLADGWVPATLSSLHAGVPMMVNLSEQIEPLEVTQAVYDAAVRLLTGRDAEAAK